MEKLVIALIEGICRRYKGKNHDIKRIWRSRGKSHLKIQNWNYSRDERGDKTVFNIRFSVDEKMHTICRIIVRKGYSDMEAAFPFECPEDERVLLSYILMEYNFSKRYATIRVDLSDGEIVNSYSFDMFPSMTPEYILNKFMVVKDIDDEIYKDVEDVCNHRYSEDESIDETPTVTEKKDKFKIDL